MGNQFDEVIFDGIMNEIVNKLEELDQKKLKKNDFEGVVNGLSSDNNVSQSYITDRYIQEVKKEINRNKFGISYLKKVIEKVKKKLQNEESGSDEERVLPDPNLPSYAKETQQNKPGEIKSKQPRFES